MALVAVPLVTSAYAAGGDNPSPPADQLRQGCQEEEDDKSSSIDDPKFIEGYRAAYATIYDRNDYAVGHRAVEGARP